MGERVAWHERHRMLLALADCGAFVVSLVNLLVVMLLRLLPQHVVLQLVILLAEAFHIFVPRTRPWMAGPSPQPPQYPVLTRAPFLILLVLP
jgi:hypothetical protein